MPIPYAFISPLSDEEIMRTEQVSLLVNHHFQDLCQHTSPALKKILQKIIVRTMWDSSTRDKYGEYYGVPAPKETPYNSGMLPPEIVIFAHPLARDYPQNDALSKKVRIVVIHEIGHHLGLSENELRRRNIV